MELKKRSMMSKGWDRLLGLLFGILTLSFITYTLKDEAFFNWAFSRHQNQWSWYLRPIFLIPFCFFAYRKSYTGTLFSLFCLFTSMVWFPTPTEVSPEVEQFLEYEKQYLLGEWNLQKILLALTIPISLFLLAFAFWRKNLWIGFSVILLMMVGKVIWSLLKAGESGISILVPAIVGLLLCLVVLAIGIRKMR